MDVEELVERSKPLKQDLLEFARRPEFDRAFKQEIRRRFGDPVRADENQLYNFFDWFIQEYRRPDGRTIVDCFLDARTDLPESEREFLRGWRDVVEGMFEVFGHDGPVIVTVNVIDDLEYRMRSNVGPSVFEQFPVGNLIATRVVPVGKEWLLSGASASVPPTFRDKLMRSAAEVAMQQPHLVFRNPDLLARGWEIQRKDRAAFVEHFGADLVVLDRDEAPKRLRKYAEEHQLAHTGFVESMLEPLHRDAATVGLIYDETDGLGVYTDFRLAEEAFAEPARVRESAYRRLLKGYLTDDEVDPTPLLRLAERDHSKADQVFRLLTGKPRFRWAADGEALLRKHKPGWYDKPPLPRTVVINDRLLPYVNAGNPVARQGDG